MWLRFDRVSKLIGGSFQPLKVSLMINHHLAYAISKHLPSY